MEDGDSSRDQHSDGGTDCNGHYIVHGRADALVKSEESGEADEEVISERKIKTFGFLLAYSYLLPLVKVL